jgi:hypothetical protein
MLVLADNDDAPVCEDHFNLGEVVDAEPVRAGEEAEVAMGMMAVPTGCIALDHRSVSTRWRREAAAYTNIEA